MKLFLILCLLLVALTVDSRAFVKVDTAGMIWVKGGEFLMGASDTSDWPGELPQHRVVVNGFYMDATEVTNQQFAEFVNATGYITTAEHPVDWEVIRKQVPLGTPKPADSLLQPGSLVFVPTSQPVDLSDPSNWWQWTIGASWRHPEGPGSTITDRMNHPVVHVSYGDAVAYATWAGKSLPTEAEWEYASRAGKNNERYYWGNDGVSDSAPQCNYWQGQFPHRNTMNDGALRTNAVRSYLPNAFGLYDMAGNVWEWCSDMYRADTYEQRVATNRQPIVNPTGPSDSWDPNDPVPTTIKRVIRSGSFLCNTETCESYRNSARRGESPDTGMSHIGFRCVISGKSY